MECYVQSLHTSIDGRCSRTKRSSSEQLFQKSSGKLCNQRIDAISAGLWLCGTHPLSPVSVPGHAVEVKMATFMVRFTEHLHFNQVFSSIFTSTCPSYEFLTTLLINLTMEGTLSEINNQFCRQVNKGVLGIVQQYRRDKATAARKSTSCLDRQSCVHKIEIRRDKTTW